MQPAYFYSSMKSSVDNYSHLVVDIIFAFSPPKIIPSQINHLAIQPIPHGRQKASFIAVAGADNSVRVLSLERERPLKQLSAQACGYAPESVCLIEMAADADAGSVGGVSVNLYLNIGLSTGILIRCVVDGITGTLSDQRSRFLGHKKVKLHKVRRVEEEILLLRLCLRRGGYMCLVVHSCVCWHSCVCCCAQLCMLACDLVVSFVCDLVWTCGKTKSKFVLSLS